MPNPTRLHQRIQLNLIKAFAAFEEASSAGEALPPPCDVFVAEFPRLRTRQPDLLFISNERLTENPPANDPAPLKPAPELVVEIISPSDKPSVLAAKIADYRSADVREIWLIRPEPKSVEVLTLSEDEILSVGTYGVGETVESGVFRGLSIAVDAIFVK